MNDTTENGSYYTRPILVAPGNYIQFLNKTYESPTIEEDSRKAYKEFIKNGCVFNDGSNNEPSSNPTISIPSNYVEGMDLTEYGGIENSTATYHSNAPIGKRKEEPIDGSELAKKQNMILIIEAVVGVIVVAILIAGCIIFSKSKKKEKEMQQHMSNQRFQGYRY